MLTDALPERPWRHLTQYLANVSFKPPTMILTGHRRIWCASACVIPGFSSGCSAPSAAHGDKYETFLDTGPVQAACIARTMQDLNKGCTGSMQTQSMSPRFCRSWLVPIFKTSEEDIIRSCGLDSLVRVGLALGHYPCRFLPHRPPWPRVRQCREASSNSSRNLRANGCGTAPLEQTARALAWLQAARVAAGVFSNVHIPGALALSTVHHGSTPTRMQTRP